MATALLIRDVSLVDVVQGRVHGPRAVVIEDGLIRDILAVAPAWSGPSLDGSGRYLAPGLIDAHVHCFLNASGTPRLDYLAASDEQHLAVGRHNLGVAIRAGITTVRDVGAPAALMTQLQAEVAAGHVVGPHLVSSGAALCRPLGHCHFFGGEVASPAEVRARIEQQIAGGAQWVKLMASGGGLTPGTQPHRAELSVEMMQAAREVAHANGIKVTAHCHATAAIERVVEAGLDMIEHASFLDPHGRTRVDIDLACRVRDGGIAVCLTVYGGFLTAQHFRQVGEAANPDDPTAIERLEARLTNVGPLHRLGVSIVGGTDCGATHTPFDTLLDEIVAFTSQGLSNAEALRTVTSDGAEQLGLSRRGRVAAGYEADLALLAADPLADLEALRRPLAVLKAGEVVSEAGDRTYPSLKGRGYRSPGGVFPYAWE